ncbi:hypothetical protein AE621_04855 [Acidovorax sp. SD340]|nr:hypothetical protein AE621_04855 [Acidovorax sp. SD340]
MPECKSGATPLRSVDWNIARTVAQGQHDCGYCVHAPLWLPKRGRSSLQNTFARVALSTRL